MQNFKPFKVYRSSAGSGKTYTLAREFLKLALQRPQYFKHILAVTFTNKATGEMKNRIIEYLYNFSMGKPHEMGAELKRHLQLSEADFKTRSSQVLSNILHGYSYFSVSTIDAFFQKVIRAFSKEAGLHGGFKLELELDKVLTEVTDALLADAGSNKKLTNWLVRFAEEKTDAGKSWDVRSDIKGLAYELFKEDILLFESDIFKVAQEGKLLDQFIKKLQAITATFQNFMKKSGEQALALIDQHSLEITDFAHGKAGVANYFNRIAYGDNYDPGKRARLATDHIEAWYTKKSEKKKSIQEAVEAGLILFLNEAIDYYDQHIKSYESARQVLKNIYAYGILADLALKLKAYKADNDVMLISDSSRFLKEITEGNDSPFIYEKIGSFYNHFLIDEFQDTSGFQWGNFRPLVRNSLSEGYTNMVVGDVKQSIYRWRGGDWKLLLEKIIQDIGPDYTDSYSLDTNFRSAENIVAFNNYIFKTLSAGVSEHLSEELEKITDTSGDDGMTQRLRKESMKIEDSYKDALQQTSGDRKKDKDKGYINITFFDHKIEAEGNIITWKDQVNEALPLLLENLQDRKIHLKDVAILVRNALDGKMVADLMLAHKNSDQAKEGYRYEVVSNEALLINSAMSVKMLLNILVFLDRPSDHLAKANVISDYQKYILRKKEISHHDLFQFNHENGADQWLPEAFLKKIHFLYKIPLYELVEELTKIFKINTIKGEFAYLQAFMDQVLSFSNSEKGDISSFLTWWKERGVKLTIQVSDDIDAAQIMTIHKSKGLQFKVVIIPYLGWDLDNDARKNNILWCKTDQVPFNTLKYLPLRYSATLKNTVYEQNYYEEKIKAYMDNLNLLYVAFTRAEEGLFAFGANKEKPDLKNVADALWQALRAENGICHEKIEPGNTTFEYGTWERLRTDRKNEPGSALLNLPAYASLNWRTKLTIKQRSGDFFTEEDEENKQARVNYGIMVHDLMARIKHKDHLEGALNELLFEGAIDEGEKSELRIKINKLFDQEQINNWFTTDWEVKTEVPILPKTGELSRLDRVMVKGEKAIVIDFKTGDQKPRDEKQVSEYIELIKQMGYREVEGYLLYIDEVEIKKITNS